MSRHLIKSSSVAKTNLTMAFHQVSDISQMHHTLLSPLLSQYFSKLLSHFPSDTISHSHITSSLLHNSNKPFLSPSARTFLCSATPRIPWTSPSQFLLLLSQLPRNHHLHSRYPPNSRNLSPFPPLHTTPPPIPLIHQLASCIFDTQNLSPSSGSPTFLSSIFHGSISCISFYVFYIDWLQDSPSDKENTPPAKSEYEKKKNSSKFGKAFTK